MRGRPAHALRRWRLPWTGLAIAAACLLVLLLAKEVRRLRLELVRERITGLKVGQFAPRLAVPLSTGDSVELGRSQLAGQIYFVYDTECPYCVRSISAWNEVYAQFGDRLHVLGVALDSAPRVVEYSSVNHLRYPSVVLADPRARDLHSFWMVPQTILLDTDGRVRYSRPGVLEHRAAVDSVVAAIRELLGPDGAR